MRHLKFAVSALAILLAGALTAGFAARAVVAPRTGEVISAGVVSVPSVQGQTAEEVLFYPWSLYESLNLGPSSFLDHPEAEEALRQEAESYSQRFFTPFTLFGADFDAFDAYCAVQYAFISRSQLSLAFLKDFPGQAEDGTPLSLSFADSIPGGAAPSSISYLVRPRNPETVTEERQAQALERVKADLREFLTSQDLLHSVVEAEELIEGEFSHFVPSAVERSIDNPITLLLGGYYALARQCSISTAPLVRLLDALWTVNGQCALFNEPLEDVLAILDETGIEVQLVSTPDQIIVLLVNGSAMMGVYYDIQLERYSGLGLSS